MQNAFQSQPVQDVSKIIGLLKACATRKDIRKGSRIHAYVGRQALLENNAHIASSLIHMYAKCGALVRAQQVLEGFPVRDVVLWNALIAGYAQQGQGEDALKCFNSMQCEGHSPDAVTFTCALKACGSIGSTSKGEEIHNKIVSLGMLENDVMLANAVVDMYARCGALAKARKVLEGLPVRDVVTWNTLIAGYAKQRQGEEALKCFDSMQQEGHLPNDITFICALKACGIIGAAAKGEQIHDKIASLGMLEKNIRLGCTLVDMYARCGALAKAEQVLEVLPVQNAITWNALITGYAQQGQGEEALRCFDSMIQKGHSPENVTFICALKACGGVGAFDKGKQIHEQVLQSGMLEKDIVLGSTLVDMYVKCGALQKALEVFKKLPLRNAVTWNALIGGYALQGESLEALNCFETMPLKGVKPDMLTLSCVLNAFSHAGQLDQAELCFAKICTKYGITPDADHYCCMVDLFGRSRKFNKALIMIEKMPCVEVLPVWVALLGACRKWGDVKMGKLAFEHALHLEKCHPAVYISLADIHTAHDIQEDAGNIDY